MAYNVRLFTNTGFNSVNIPFDRTLLNQCAYIDLEAAEILQDRWLSQITVAATWEQVKDGDYAIVGDFCYSVGTARMESAAVATLELTPDFYLSAGGISGFTILDGITSRATISDDTWGAYTDDDPLTAPQLPLRLVTEWDAPTGEGTIPDTMPGDPVFVESTVSLPYQAGLYEGVTYTDSETNLTVTTPKTYPITGERYKVTLEGDDSDDITDFEIDGAVVNDRTAIYVSGDNKAGNTDTAPTVGQTTADGLAQVRALGIEQGSILNQWRVPREYIGEIKQNAGVTSIGVVGDLDRATSCPIISVAGRKGTITTGIKPNYADVKNKRVLYGTYNKYGIMTTAGNSGEFRPEEITTESEAPEVSYIADPRADGKPYFRFTTVNGNTDFWYNFVAGSRWQNVPLVYQGASGSALTRLNFDNMRASERLEFEQNTVNARLSQAGNIGDALANLGMMAAAASGAGALGSQAGSLTASQSIQMGQYMQQGSQAGGGIVSSLLNVLGTEYKLQQYIARYKQDKANELSQLYQNTTIYTPTVNFPYNADILRDVKGNSVLIYKYRLQDLDVKRIDKLLTMYGYKEAEPLTADNFNRRTHFDYIECSSVTVTGKPRWWNDGIAAQLRNGVRIWHELPNVAAYDDNPVRSTT